MKLFNSNDHATTKDLEIQLRDAVHTAEVGTPEYETALDLYIKFKTAEATNKAAFNRLSMWTPMIGNVTGITLIGLFEAYGQIFTSKAMPLLFGRMFK